MAPPPRIRVHLSGDRRGEYLVTEERPDGSLVLTPTSGSGSVARSRAARGALGELLAGVVTRPSAQGPATVSDLLAESGVVLDAGEEVREFVSLDLDGAHGFVAITSARFIFVPGPTAASNGVREWLLTGFRAAAPGRQHGHPRLRVRWANGEIVLSGGRRELDRVSRRLGDG